MRASTLGVIAASSGAGGGSGPGSDPNFANVTFLSSFEGTDGDTTYTNDGSGATPILRGAAEISSDTAKFGSTSLNVKGSSDGYEAAGTLSNLGTNDFTIETFFYYDLASQPAAWKCMLGDFKVGGTNGSWGIYIRDNRHLIFEVRNQVSVEGTTVISVGQVWRHAAVSKNGNTIRLFLDGVMENKITDAGWNFASGNPFYLGWNDTGFSADRWEGYLDEVRITNGVGRYDDDGGFTVPTEPYPRS